MIKLGNKVRDMITGFAGVAIARCEYLYGCSQILIAPTELKDGKPIDSIWFDDQRVELVETTERPMSLQSVATAGGPQPSPPARVTPPAR